MIRALAVAVLAVMLAPASAEAAKFRSNGSRSHDSQARPANRDGSLIVTPGLRTRRDGQAAASATVPLRLSSAEEPRVWCRSQVVVGGFCVLN